MEIKCPFCNHLLNFLVGDKFLWNARENVSIRASRIRNFSIEPVTHIETHEEFYGVVAWIKDDESVKMGIFETMDEAMKFLKKLHKEIEGT
jgi:hypothetical protein